MKFGLFLTEFEKGKNTVLKIGRTLPHMVSAGMDTSPTNVAKYVNAPVEEVEQILSKVKSKPGNPALSQEVHAALAAACYLRNRALNPSQYNQQTLEDVSGMPYAQLHQVAVTNLPDIQKELESFRIGWFEPIVKVLWKDMKPAERKAMILQAWEGLSHGGSAIVAAADVADQIVRTGRVELKQKESLRKAIDKFLSSDDPDARRMNLRRPIGKTDRGPTDGGGSATVIPYKPNR